MEISEFLERKLARRFQTFDFGDNGQIERSDFETSAGRVADEFGHSADSPARQRLLELSLGLWDHLDSGADSDRDGFITTPDLLQAIHDFYFDDNPDGVGSWLLGQLPDSPPSLVIAALPPPVTPHRCGLAQPRVVRVRVPQSGTSRLITSAETRIPTPDRDHPIESRASGG